MYINSRETTEFRLVILFSCLNIIFVTVLRSHDVDTAIIIMILHDYFTLLSLKMFHVSPKYSRFI